MTSAHLEAVARAKKKLAQGDKDGALKSLFAHEADMAAEEQQEKTAMANSDMASMYDAMDMGSEEETPEEETAEAETGDAGLDAQFEMHAKDAGMNTPEKVEAFKAAIERCVTLREENMYGEDMGTEEADEDAEI